MIEVLAKMWSNWNSHTLLVGVQNTSVTLESYLAVSNKIKYTPTPMILQFQSKDDTQEKQVHMSTESFVQERSQKLNSS